MEVRYEVVRGYVKYQGTVYYAGTLLPRHFTERDRHRLIHPSRVVSKEVPLEDAGTKENPEVIKTETPVVVKELATGGIVSKEIVQEAITGKSNTVNTMTKGTKITKKATSKTELKTTVEARGQKAPQTATTPTGAKTPAKK